MEVRILTENTVYKRGFLGEHGLSMLLETEGKRYLFDTGQTDVFLRNADKMKLDLEHLDGIILSHGHYDHCGGMKYWARKHISSQHAFPNIPIYIDRKAFDKKYSGHPKTGELLFGGIDAEAEAWMKQSADIHYTEHGRATVAENVYLLSEVPPVTDFESVPARFFKEIQVEGSQGTDNRNQEKNGPGIKSQSGNNPKNESDTKSQPGNNPKNESDAKSQPGNNPDNSLEIKSQTGNNLNASFPRLVADHMEDEQVLVVREQEGLCVFAGCAHPGIVNCLNYVQSSFPGEHIHAAVAGMHLKGCPPLQLKKTIQALQEFGIDVVVPLHCTGLLAIAAIKEALGEQCLLAEVGKKLVF